MKRINLVLADKEEAYLSKLSKYIMDKSDRFDIYTFTKQESLEKFLSAPPITIDILALDISCICQEAEMVMVPLKVMLSVDGNAREGFIPIKKYQRTLDMLEKLLVLYAEATGIIDVVKGQSVTKIAGFYSPAGGSGCTTLSLCTALAAAVSGYRVCYLNMEDICSVKNILREKDGNMTDVYLALKTKKSNLGLKFKSCCSIDENTGMFYMPGTVSIMEPIEEIGGDEVVSILDQIRELDEFDMLILDFSSGLDEKKILILNYCENIFMPVTDTWLALEKVNSFFEENHLHSRLKSLTDKTHLIWNRADIHEIERTELPMEKKIEFIVPARPHFILNNRIPHLNKDCAQDFLPIIQAIVEN